MIDEEIKKVWRRAVDDEAAKVEATKLLINTESKLNRFEKSLKWRDRREIGAAFLAIIIFAAYIIFLPSLQSKIGSGIIILGCLLIIYKLRQARENNREPDETLDLRQYFTAHAQKIERQIELLNSVWAWYLSPIYFGIMVMIINSTISTFTVVYLVLVTVFFIAIIWLNKYSVKKDLIPLKEEVNRTLQQMGNSGRGSI